MTNEEIFVDYCELMGFHWYRELNGNSLGEALKAAYLKNIQDARDEDPSINCGAAYIDWGCSRDTYPDEDEPVEITGD